MIGIDIKPGTTQRGPNMIKDVSKPLMFGDKSQDYVFSSFLLNELDNWETVLKDWWRVIKDNGYLILFLPIIEEGEKLCTAKMVVDAMVQNKPWQFVEARMNGKQLFHVYRKCDRPTKLDAVIDPAKVCAVVKLGAHGDALWASSVFPGLKEQGFHTILFTQTTGEAVLRHDPYIDEIVNFENRVPMGELGELFQWLKAKYGQCRILIECCEGVLLPSPGKIQYQWPLEARHATMNLNYLDMHHLVAEVPLFPKHQKFYPTDEEKTWANELRGRLNEFVVVLVPRGSGCSKFWPYMADLTKELLKRDDISVVVLGDQTGITLEPHENLLNIGIDWEIRRAMTFVQLADVVAGQETGLLNSVGFEKDVHKVVLLTHSSEENLTRDWSNTEVIRMYPECAGKSGCHLLHFDWSHCNKDEATQSAKCQAMITVEMVLERIDPYLVSRETERMEATA
jgi:SAM-dependent methyltransferase